jgi:purine-binding chemotaxis protein CheW
MMVVAENLDGGLVVVFTAGGAEYGLRIGQVQEIIRPLPISRVPNAPERIEGVINLRGNVVPVINLHKRLAMEAMAPSGRSRVIIVHTRELTAGIIVDSVKEVLDLPAEQIEPPLTDKSDAAHLSGIGKSAGRVIMLLDLENILWEGVPE